jgi:hypothetical protein
MLIRANHCRLSLESALRRMLPLLIFSPTLAPGSHSSTQIRGQMNINYGQYNNILLEQGFFELSDLANVSAEQLVAVMESRVNFGVANHLVTYAKEDFAPFATAKRARVD